MTGNATGSDQSYVQPLSRSRLRAATGRSHLPIARSGPLVGAVLGDAVRYVFSICVVLGAGAVLGFDFAGGVAGTIAGCLVVLGFALALCWAWVWLGLLMKTPQGVQGIAFLLMFPLTFGSNVFVPLALRAYRRRT